MPDRVQVDALLIAVGFNGGRVASINELTGAVQIIGFTSLNAGVVASLARDPGGVATLLTLDPDTGLTTPIAPLSENLNIQALAIPPTGGLLYATSNSDVRSTQSTRVPAKSPRLAPWA